MTIQRFFGLTAAILTAQVALATMPFTNDVFGKMESTLDYCAQVDSSAAAKYKEKKKLLVKGTPENEVAEARQTDEYQSAYKWMSDELPKMPKDQVVKACAAALETKK
jgi:hypothetical protein